MANVGNVVLIKQFNIGPTCYAHKISTYVDYNFNQLKSDNKFGLNIDDALELLYTF